MSSSSLAKKSSKKFRVTGVFDLRKIIYDMNFNMRDLKYPCKIQQKLYSEKCTVLEGYLFAMNFSARKNCPQRKTEISPALEISLWENRGIKLLFIKM